MKPWIQWIAVCLIVSVVQAGAQEAPPVVDPSAAAELSRRLNEVVARVGDRQILRREVAVLMQIKLAQRGMRVAPEDIPAFEFAALEEIIGRQLLLNEARGRAPSNLTERVAAQMAKARSEFGDEEKFRRALEQARMTPDEYQTQVRDSVLFGMAVEQMIKEHGKVSDDEVQKFYQDNQTTFRTPEVVAISHIMLRVPDGAADELRQAKRAQIEAARALVKGGESFAAIARKVSEDLNTADNGGALGNVRRGQLPPDIEAAAFHLKPNTVSDVVVTPAGFHIFTVTDRKPSQALTFQQVKSQIEQMLRERTGMEYVRQHVAQLREKVKVEILLPSPTPASRTNGVPVGTLPTK
jgi:parvulin-like peptidyl-prolyl isomerase